MFTGLFIALLAALSEASKDIFFSSTEVKNRSHILKVLALTLVAIPILSLAVFINGWPEVQPAFWYYVSAQALLLGVASWLYMHALASGSVTQTQPILALSAVFLLITNPLMTNNVVPPIGWAGVLVIALGVYLSQLPESSHEETSARRLFQPFKEIVYQPGVRSKLGVAIIYSITANLDQLCIEAADGPSYLLVQSILISLLFAALLVFRLRTAESQPSAFYSFQFWRQLTPGGVIHTVTLLLHMWALSFTTVPYVIAVKRVSILFVSLWGYYIRRDRKATWTRILAALMVVFGVALIVIFG